MSNVSQWKKRLRSLGRSLRPLEQEAESLAQELEEELIHSDESDHAITPAQVERYCDLDDLQGIAESASSDLNRTREDIARFLRPRPRVRPKKTT